jgi:hypothetical protein
MMCRPVVIDRQQAFRAIKSPRCWHTGAGLSTNPTAMSNHNETNEKSTDNDRPTCPHGSTHCPVANPRIDNDRLRCFSCFRADTSATTVFIDGAPYLVIEDERTGATIEAEPVRVRQ